MMSVVGLVLHPGRDSAPAMSTITDWARDRGVTVLGLDGETKRITGDVTVCTPQAMAERANLLVSLGGDGPMLRTMRLAAGTGTPVLGVNLGRLGFLAEVDVPDLTDALSAIDRHEFTAEPRAAVSAAFADQRTLAFNDIDLARISGDGSIAAVELCVEGNPFVRSEE